MILKEKHITYLNGLPLGEWVEYDSSLEKGITVVTINRLIEMGLLEAISLHKPKNITDENVKRGSVKMTVKKWTSPKKSLWPHYIKKISETYKDKDYELATLRDQVADLQKKLATYENKGENAEEAPEETK